MSHPPSRAWGSISTTSPGNVPCSSTWQGGCLRGIWSGFHRETEGGGRVTTEGEDGLAKGRVGAMASKPRVIPAHVLTRLGIHGYRHEAYPQEQGVSVLPLEYLHFLPVVPLVFSEFSIIPAFTPAEKRCHLQIRAISGTGVWTCRGLNPSGLLRSPF